MFYITHSDLFNFFIIITSLVPIETRPASTNQSKIISKTRTHRSRQSILLQIFFATQCYTWGSEIWDLNAKLALIGTKFGLWSHLGQSPKFRTLLERLHPVNKCGRLFVLDATVTEKNPNIDLNFWFSGQQGWGRRPGQKCSGLFFSPKICYNMYICI